MPKKKFSIRLSLVFLITILILATSITLLSVSAAFYRNTINWVLETLSQKVSDHIIDKVTSNVHPHEEIQNARETLKRIEISPNGKILLLDEHYRIIAASEREEGKILPDRFGNKKVKVTDIKDPLILESFQKYKRNEKRKSRKFFKRKFDHFPFWQGFRKYLAIYKPFDLENGDERLLALIFPYRDYFTSMTRNNIIMYSLALLFVLAAIYISIRISRKISQPLTELAEETDRIRNFELDSTKHIDSTLYEVEQMSQAIDNMRSGLKSFKKYVPSELVRELIHLNKEAALGGEKKNLSVFFSDIANFTTISEQLQPEQLVEFLGEYLGEMTKIIMDHKGTVDKYIGDAVMAFWGAPNEFDNHAELACRAALLYKKRLAELSEKWRSEGKPDFFSRIGVNTGDLIVGNMGYEERMNYTVIGDTVNLASRLEALNKNYGTQIMIGEQTYNVVKDLMETRFLDIVAVKGKKEGVKIYELIGTRGEIESSIAQHRKMYEEALDLYLKQQFNEAKEAFRAAVDFRDDDKASKVFFNRSLEFSKNPPDDDWNGVFIATSK